MRTLVPRAYTWLLAALMPVLALFPTVAAQAAEEPALDKGAWTIIIVIVASIIGLIIIYLMNKGSPPPKIER